MISDDKYIDEQELIRRMRSGDERVLVEIYDLYWEKMLAIAFNRLGNLEEAEECVQDVLYKLWKLRDNLSLGDHELAYYLTRSIRNQSFNILERRYRERLRAEGYPLDEQTNFISPERELMLRELQQQIDKAIAALPAQCQLVFTLSRKEGFSNKEIAEKLHLSENTVRSHIKKANKDIRGNTELLTALLFAYLFLR